MELRRWLDRHWAVVASVVTVVIFLPVALAMWGSDEPVDAFLALAVGVSFISTIWTVFFLRRSFEIQHRPYIGVTGCQLVPVDGGSVVLRMALTNSGNVPGVTRRQTSEWDADEGPQLQPAGVTERDVIFPGEVITLGFGAPVVPPGRARFFVEYANLEESRDFEFEIVYLLAAGQEPSIVRKRAT